MAGGVNDNVKDDWQRGEYLTAEWAQSVGSNLNRNNRFPLGGMDQMLSCAAGSYPGQAPDDGILFINSESSLQMPAYGIGIVNEAIAHGQTIAGGTCPNIQRSTFFGCQSNFIVNGPAPVDALNFGYGQDTSGTVIVAYDTSDGMPVPGDIWGPKSGTWLAKKYAGGFYVTGVEDSTNGWLRAFPYPMNDVDGTIASDCAPGSTATLTIVANGVSTGITVVVSNISSCTIKSGSGNNVHRAAKSSRGPWYFVAAIT